MNPFLNTLEQELADIMLAFGNTHVEDLAPHGFKKYVLNKLRWIPIDFGISHFKLTYPPMPILDLIQIGASIEEIITKGSAFDTSAYYEILAARNIIKLLYRAYSFSEDVKRFFDLKIQTILSSIAADDLIEDSNKLLGLPRLLQRTAIDQGETIKSLADFILQALEPITDLAEYKNIICQKITNGTCAEKNILLGYKLYFLLFLCFLLGYYHPTSPLRFYPKSTANIDFGIIMIIPQSTQYANMLKRKDVISNGNQIST